jgi:hypothetical protein
MLADANTSARSPAAMRSLSSPDAPKVKTTRTSPRRRSNAVATSVSAVRRLPAA